VTSRGFGALEMEQIATWIDRALKAAEDEAELGKINAEVAALCTKFPVPGLD
jgi:glycine hydroxymethyltransferase